jgi:hypothetical protein
VFHGGEVGLPGIMYVNADLLDGVGNFEAGECEVLEGPARLLK